MSIQENLNKIKEQIGNASVKIIAVTKYATTEQISLAYQLGIHDFGESYAQDAIVKINSLTEKYKSSGHPIKWHFIGRLQKNKIKLVLGKFCLIHSVDSVELAELVNKKAKENNLAQDILLQVNISEEESKSGFKIDKLKGVFKHIINLPNLNIRGLMTMAPKTSDTEISYHCFSGLSNLKEELNTEFNTNLKELSMGMSDDYKIALKCGATMIRIGRALFKDS